MSQGSGSRTRLAAIVTVAAALLVGGLIGKRIGEGSNRVLPRSPGVAGLPMTRDSLLGLLRVHDSQQRVAVESILAEGTARADSMMQSLLAEVRATTSRTRARLMEALSPEQRGVLDSLLAAQPKPGPRRR